jgi:hypothetical protein
VPQSATTDSGENASAGFARYFAVNGCRMAASLAVAVTTPLVAGCGSTQRHVTAHVKPPVYCLVGAAVRYPTAAQQKAAIARRIRFLQERHDPCASTEIPAYERDLHSVKAAPDVVGERLDRAQAELRADGLTHFGTGYGGPLAHGPGPASDWTVCGTSPKPGQLLPPPWFGIWLYARHTCSS